MSLPYGQDDDSDHILYLCLKIATDKDIGLDLPFENLYHKAKHDPLLSNML
jgi:hypothetical protein